ncbi:MAG: CpXC domain-containing protein [Myxococcota bacterium]
MAEAKRVDVTCPECGRVQPFLAHTSVNVTLEPALKRQLMSTELLRFTCAACGFSNLTLFPLTYHDMDSRLLFRMTAGGPDPGPLTVEQREQLLGYVLRVVRNLDELQEKVRITDAGLDDRAVELMKLDMLRIIREETHAPGVEIRFHRVHEKPDGARMLLFEAWRVPGVPPGKVLNMDSPWRNYQGAEERVRLHASDASPRWLRVDTAYVEALVVTV